MRERPRHNLLAAPRDQDYRLSYLLLGAGVKSSAVYILASLKDPRVPRVDYAVFADTGDEPEGVYRHLERLTAWGKERNGPPIEQVSMDAKLSVLMAISWIPIPAFTRRDNGKIGMLRRECTHEAKLKPINSLARQKLGLKFHEKAGADRRALAIIGIASGETARVSDSKEAWNDHDYPLIRANLSRTDARNICAGAGFTNVQKSACVYCPFQGKLTWQRRAREHPEDLRKAIAVDDAIRDPTKRTPTLNLEPDDAAGRRATGVKTGQNRYGIQSQDIFCHRSCIPLREIDFNSQPTLPGIEGEDEPDDWTNECTGACGT